jgi:hypothetical protein
MGAAGLPPAAKFGPKAPSHPETPTQEPILVW